MMCVRATADVVVPSMAGGDDIIIIIIESDRTFCFTPWRAYGFFNAFQRQTQQTAGLAEMLLGFSHGTKSAEACCQVSFYASCYNVSARIGIIKICIHYMLFERIARYTNNDQLYGTFWILIS